MSWIMRFLVCALALLALASPAWAQTFPQVGATAVTPNAGQSDRTSHVYDLPSGVVSGSRVICAASFDGQPGVTWPSGWNATANEIKDPSGATVFPVQQGTVILDARFRDMDGTEGSTITVTTSVIEKSSATCWRLSGHHSAPPEATGATDDPPDTTPDPSGITPSWGSAATLWIVALGHDNGNTPTVTGFPTNYGNTTYASDTSSTGAPLATARRELTASSETPGAFTFTGTAEGAAMATFAIRPGAACIGRLPLIGVGC